MKIKTGILIVENDAHHAYNTFLEPKGYNVFTAPYASEGLTLCRKSENNIHIILLDMHLPDKTYFFSVPAFLAINPDYYIICMSQILTLSDIPNYFKEKVKDILLKPFSQDDLFKRLNNFIPLKNKSVNQLH